MEHQHDCSYVDCTLYSYISSEAIYLTHMVTKLFYVCGNVGLHIKIQLKGIQQGGVFDLRTFGMFSRGIFINIWVFLCFLHILYIHSAAPPGRKSWNRPCSGINNTSKCNFTATARLQLHYDSKRICAIDCSWLQLNAEAELQLQSSQIGRLLIYSDIHSSWQ